MAVEELEAFHACDSCGTRSSIVWYNRRSGGLFTFCGHHSLECSTKLLTLGFKIIMAKGVKPLTNAG